MESANAWGKEYLPPLPAGALERLDDIEAECLGRLQCALAKYSGPQPAAPLRGQCLTDYLNRIVDHYAAYAGALFDAYVEVYWRCFPSLRNPDIVLVLEGRATRAAYAHCNDWLPK